jgi:hypothetical protein
MADDKTFTQEQLDAAVAKATGDVEGLKQKVEELIGDNKKLKADLRKTQDIKPEDVAAIEAERDKALADLTAAQKAAKDATSAAEKATKALETEQGFTAKLLKQDGIKTQLLANGVKDETYIADLTDAFSSKVAIKVEGEDRVAMVGDKTLVDHIKEWAGSDAGKKYVAAPANGGGGAPGSGDNKGGVKQITRTEFDALQPAEKVTFGKEGGKVVDAAA